jgi:chitinase
MFSRYTFFLLAQLIWTAPACSHAVVPPSQPNPTGNPINTLVSVPSKTVAAAWYAGWHSSDFTLQNVSWSKYNSVIYAFA